MRRYAVLIGCLLLFTLLFLSCGTAKPVSEKLSPSIGEPEVSPKEDSGASSSSSAFSERKPSAAPQEADGGDPSSEVDGSPKPDAASSEKSGGSSSPAAFSEGKSRPSTEKDAASDESAQNQAAGDSAQGFPHCEQMGSLQVYLADGTSLMYDLSAYDAGAFFSSLPMEQFILQEREKELSTIDMSSGPFVRLSGDERRMLFLYQQGTQALFEYLDGTTEYYQVPEGMYEAAVRAVHRFKSRAMDGCSGKLGITFFEGTLEIFPSDEEEPLVLSAERATAFLPQIPLNEIRLSYDAREGSPNLENTTCIRLSAENGAELFLFKKPVHADESVYAFYREKAFSYFCSAPDDIYRQVKKAYQAMQEEN
ncbi:MAG: hypothetical protein HFG27_09530 [Provencibacterium sp.]|jgi:hypothetical protein|nr:hypothetical protein [Provencibacterium sp.]